MTNPSSLHPADARLAIAFGVLALLATIDLAGDLMLPEWSTILDVVIAAGATVGTVLHGWRHARARRLGDDLTRRVMAVLGTEPAGLPARYEAGPALRAVPVRPPEYRN